MTLSVQGAVIRRDEDPRKQLPIADAVVTLSNGVTSIKTQSDASGYFRITFPEVVWPGQTLNLNFQNPGYQTLNMPVQAALRLSTRELYVAAMKPLAAKSRSRAEWSRVGYFQYPGSLHVQHGNRRKHRQRGQSVSGGESGQRTMQSSCAVFS